MENFNESHPQRKIYPHLNRVELRP